LAAANNWLMVCTLTTQARRMAASKASSAPTMEAVWEMAALEARGLRFDGWATPGANPGAAALDVARTAARRAERRLTALAGQGRHLRPDVSRFINRLSDLLWLLAREAEQ
jgi:cob(I)alamin adenosyltransferase